MPGTNDAECTLIPTAVDCTVILNRWKMSNRTLLSLAFLAGAWSLSATPSIADTSASEAAKPAVDVIMYTTSTCGYCVKARSWFTERNVSWDERDIETSESARAEWIAQGGVGTPLILINGTRISGFSVDALTAELAKYQ